MFAKSFRRAVHAVVFSGVLLLCAVCAEDAVPAPINVDKDVVAFVVIPDLKALLNTIEGIAKQVMPPEQFKPGMLAAQIGNELGDPTLAGLGNKPILLTLFKIPADYNPQAAPPPAALYVPVAADAAVLDKVKAALADNPKIQGAYEDGLLIVSSPNSMDKAKAGKSIYNKVVDAKLQSDARIFISLASLAESFGPMLKAQLDQARDQALDEIKNNPMPPQFGITAETAAQVVRVFFNAVKGAVGQADAVQLDLKVKPDSVQQELLFSAKPGSLLAELLSGNAVATNTVQSFLIKGFVSQYINVDMKNYAAVYKKLLGEIAADSNTADLAKNEVLTTAHQMLESVGGEQISVVGAGAAGPDVVSASTITDQAKYLAAVDKMMSWLGPDSVFAKFYASMGMKFNLNFKKNVRQHAGNEIHRMDFTMDMANVPKEQAEKLKAALPTYEVAIPKGYALMASNPATLDVMMDKVTKGDFTPSGVTLKSMAAFGKGKNVYVDYDMIGYMKFIMAKMDLPGGDAMFKNLKANDPMLFAYSQGNGRAMLQVGMPLAPILDFVKLGHAIEAGGPPKEPDTSKDKF